MDTKYRKSYYDFEIINNEIINNEMLSFIMYFLFMIVESTGEESKEFRISVILNAFSGIFQDSLTYTKIEKDIRIPYKSVNTMINGNLHLINEIEQFKGKYEFKNNKIYCYELTKTPL